MKIKSLLLAAFLTVAMAFSSTAQTSAQASLQTNAPADITNDVADLKATLAALMKQIAADAATNPPVIASVVFSNGVAVATNLVDTTTVAQSVEDEFSPLFSLLVGHTAWGAKAVAWLLAFAAAISPWRTKIKHWISDAFNSYAATATAGQDEWLRALFSKVWYKAAAFGLNFAGISLPTLADLDRVIALQKQALAAATAVPAAGA